MGHPSAEIEQLYLLFSQRLVRAYAELVVYTDVFEGEEKLAVLNGTAAETFGILQAALAESINMEAACFIDTTKSAAHLQKMVTLLKRIAGHEGIATQLNTIRDAASKAGKSLEEHRHQFYAHKGFKLTIGHHQLPALERKDIEEVLRHVQTFINAYEHHFGLGHVAYSETCLAKPNDLIRRLKESIAYRKEVPDWVMLDNPERERNREICAAVGLGPGGVPIVDLSSTTKRGD